MTGATIKLDANGDSEGNFSVLALKQAPYRYQFDEGQLFTCSYSMVPVAQFYGELLVSVLIIVVGILLINLICTYTYNNNLSSLASIGVQIKLSHFENRLARQESTGRRTQLRF